MATTGAEVKNIFNDTIDKAFSAFYNDTKLNRLFKTAITNEIQQYIRVMDQQEEYDFLSAIVKTESMYVPTNNQINTSGSTVPVIADYKHFLRMKAKFEQQVLDLNVTDATNKTPIVITVDDVNNFRSSEQFKITGIIGNTSANATHYVKQVSSKKFELYSDKKLQTPVAGNGDYTSGGTLFKVFYNDTKPLFSDRKISQYGEPTVTNPKYETVQNKIKIFPLEEPCTEITIDYMTDTAVFIDVTDSSTDLEITYPLKFIYSIVDEAARLFYERVHDKEGADFEVFEKQVNP